jgi:hypothetical protein
MEKQLVEKSSWRVAFFRNNCIYGLKKRRNVHEESLGG